MDILRSYLINLGFRVERGSERQFEASVGKSAARVAELGAAIEGMGAALAAVVTKMSDRFEDLYYASQRIGSSVENIRAFSFGLSQVGLKAGDAQAALDGLADRMRSNPGTEGLLKSLGVQTRDAAGELRDTTQVFEEAMATLHKRYQGQSYFAGQSMAQSWFGVDPRTYLAMGRDFSDFEAKQKARFKRYGADQQALAEQGKQFAQRFRDAQSSVVTLAEKVFIGLSVRMMPALERFSAWMDKNGGLIADRLQHVLEGVWGLALGVGRIITKAADALVGLDKATHGASTAILGVLAVWRLLNLGFLATPLGAAIGAVVALGAAIVGLFNDYQTWARGGASLFDWSGWKDTIDGAGKAFDGLGKSISDFAKMAGGAIGKTLPGIGGAVADLGKALGDLGGALAPIASWFLRTFGPGVVNFVTVGIKTITDSIHALADAVRVVADLLRGDFKAAAKDAAKFGSDTLKTVKEPLGVFKEFAGDPKKANTLETDRQGGRVVATRRYDADGKLAEEHKIPAPTPASAPRQGVVEHGDSPFARAMMQQMGGRSTDPAPIVHAQVGPIKTTVTGSPDVKLKNDRLPPLHPDDRSVLTKLVDWLNGQPPPNGVPPYPPGAIPHGPEGVRQIGAAANATAARIMAFFESKGRTHNQAAALAANAYDESGFDPTARNSIGMTGLFQWDTKRRAAFAKWAGHDIGDKSVGRERMMREQLEWANFELTKGLEKPRGEALSHIGGARNAAIYLNDNYERNQSPAAAARRAEYADRFASMKVDAPQPAGARTVNINSQTDVKVQGANANEIGQSVGREVGRKNADLVRSTRKVVQ